MKVLVIGSGAREHALVRALDADCAVDEVLAAPGNPGIADLARCEPLADVTDAAAVLDLAARHTVDLVVIGPEAPLVAGVADVLRGEGYAVFGPSAEAARLEGSKSFAKEVMAAAGVPTALAHVCTTEAEVAAAVDGFGTPHVVKDDGLAAGKGVIVTDDREAALATLAPAWPRRVAAWSSRSTSTVRRSPFSASPTGRRSSPSRRRRTSSG